MGRPPAVREAIHQLTSAEGRHDWSIDDLARGLAARGAEAAFSTVYRAVLQMERSGALARVDLGDGQPRYERAGDHHEHVRCTGCGEVAEVPGCAVEDLQRRVARSTGFLISGHQVVFTGLCPGCRGSE
jgi:Fur family ferric uptake transcriptional regulator